MSDAKQLQFNYTIEEFSPDKLALSLKFDKSAYVSYTPEKDFIVIELEDFRDADGNLII